MPDLALEQWHLVRMLEGLGRERSAWCKTEEPDFVVSIDGRDIGIEITRFFPVPESGAKPDQELDRLGELSVDRAKSLFKEATDLALYVSVHFARRPESKRHAYELSERIATAVSNIAKFGIGYDWASALPEVADLHVQPSVDGVDELWNGGMGGIVRVIQPPEIQIVIDEKHKKLARYRLSSDTVWLGIVHDIFRGGALSELASETAEYEFRSSFDKVFWVDVQKPASYELRIR